MEYRGDYLCCALRPISLQRGRRHRGPDQECPLHVPQPAVEVNLKGSSELHSELVGGGARGEVHRGRRPRRPLGVRHPVQGGHRPT